MRMWSLAPALLDRQALVACWRETLLAQAVLAGKTRGYSNHPQLDRFKRTSDPLHTVGMYLEGLYTEASARSFTFNRSLIQCPGTNELEDASQGSCATHAPQGSQLSNASHEFQAARQPQISVTAGQLRYETEHLRRKLQMRSPEQLPLLDDTLASLDWEDARGLSRIAHPLFVVIPGGIEPWEKI